MIKSKVFSTIIISAIIISLLTNIFFLHTIIMFGKANPGDIGNAWYNSTKLRVSVLELAPRINWYDFQYNQSGTWVSKLNDQIDVDNISEYRFIINISSDQGWDDIEYVNITAWYDDGDDNSTYNQTLGGNLNMMLQYENTTGTAFWRLLWPVGGEVNEGNYMEITENDTYYGSYGYTECRNLSFSFIPSYQFRYAPGDGSWDKTKNVTNDLFSWNFNITVTDSGEGALQKSIVWINDEFGVYSYSEIVSAGWPEIVGNPGEIATANNNITLVTRSNGNYSLSVDVDNLTHVKLGPTVNMSRETVWVRGGDKDISANFTALGDVIYLYGDVGTYHPMEVNGTSLTTNDVEYKCNIPFGQIAGDYTATIRYHLTTT
ncbi:MAG: hypothetical protein ACQXXD_05940 [Thermoplasmatota archaeon]